MSFAIDALPGYRRANETASTVITYRASALMVRSVAHQTVGLIGSAAADPWRSRTNQGDRQLPHMGFI